MNGTTPILFLVRAEEQSTEFLSMCEERIGKPIANIISPIMKIVSTGDVPDLSIYRTVVLTSLNAVKFAGAALESRTVVTVGERTAAAAIAQGANATCLGRNLDELIGKLDTIEGPMVHLRGVHTRGDIADAAGKLGKNCDNAVIYDQVEQPLSATAHEYLAQGNAIVPIFSPRTGQMLSKHPMHRSTKILAISAAAARAWPEHKAVFVAKSPDADAMVTLVQEFF